MEPVAVIEADKLLEWLQGIKSEVRNARDESTQDMMMSFYDGYLSAMWKVTRYVEKKKYLVDKEREEL